MVHPKQILKSTRIAVPYPLIYGNQHKKQGLLGSDSLICVEIVELAMIVMIVISVEAMAQA